MNSNVLDELNVLTSDYWNRSKCDWGFTCRKTYVKKQQNHYSVSFSLFSSYLTVKSRFCSFADSWSRSSASAHFLFCLRAKIEPWTPSALTSSPENVWSGGRTKLKTQSCSHFVPSGNYQWKNNTDQEVHEVLSGLERVCGVEPLSEFAAVISGICDQMWSGCVYLLHAVTDVHTDMQVIYQGSSSLRLVKISRNVQKND